jgi:hypothetical protein
LPLLAQPQPTRADHASAGKPCECVGEGFSFSRRFEKSVLAWGAREARAPLRNTIIYVKIIVL